MITKNIMIVGVGGQGSLLASRILGAAATAGGYEVKISEVHGMSQRGGSVVTYVRYGEDVSSPVICQGEADVILSFELLEAARWLPFLRPGGTLITATQEINPMPVIIGAAEYPADLAKKIGELGINIIAEDAAAIAGAAGNGKAANVALIGLGAHVLGFDTAVLRGAVEECVPAKAKEINLRAFDMAASHQRAQ